MQLTVNGDPREVPEGTTVATLLGLEGLAERRVAVEVDGEIVPRGQHATVDLAPGAKVEIVHALGGG